MKKILSILTAIVLAAALTACSGNTNEAKPETTDNSSTDNTVVTETEKPAE